MITDVALTIGRLRKAGLNSVNQVTAGMKAAAKYVFDESQKLVPKETFALQRSGRIVETYGEKYTTTLDIIYGDETAFYALWVHEDPLKLHGIAFNVMYDKEIAAGYYRLKDPWETFHFLSIPASDLTAVKSALVKGMYK